ncbi:MAG: hypothetical protein JOZ29_21705 [Deltaproteobacteria bacterium]|nr:hypothetical protein [Deltaproteobacteria bacterium]
MKKLVTLGLSLTLGKGIIAAAPAAPASANGPTALALAAVMGQYSSMLSPRDRYLLARLFNADFTIRSYADQKISVKVKTIVCRTSNVDITARSCELKFGKHGCILNGHRANELNATIVQAGVSLEGAAGSNVLSLSHLVCTIGLNEIMQKAGGGAECTFNTGP